MAKGSYPWPIVNHRSFYPGFVEGEVDVINVLGGWAYMYVTHEWIRVMPLSGPGALITLGSKTRFSSSLFTTGLACLTPKIPCEDAMPSTSPSKDQGNIRHFGPGMRMSSSPDDRQYSFPETLA